MEYRPEYAGSENEIEEESMQLIDLPDTDEQGEVHSESVSQIFGAQRSSAAMPGIIKRAVSSPNVRTMSSGDLSDKKKNKLGYHRTAVACGHCRRRKIRCVPALDDHRCQNCIRLKKDCHFFPVDQPLGSNRRPRTTPKGEGANVEGEQSASDASPGVLTSSNPEQIDHVNSQLHTPPLTLDGAPFRRTTVDSAPYPDPSPPQTHTYNRGYEQSSFHSTAFLDQSPRTYYPETGHPPSTSSGQWVASSQHIPGPLATSPYPMTPMSMPMAHSSGEHPYHFSSPGQSFEWPSSHTSLIHQNSYASAPDTMQQQHQHRSNTHPSFQRRMTLPPNFHGYPESTTEYLAAQGVAQHPVATQYGHSVFGVHHDTVEGANAWGTAHPEQQPHMSSSGHENFSQGWFSQPAALPDVREEDDPVHVPTASHYRSNHNFFQHNPG